MLNATRDLFLLRLLRQFLDVYMSPFLKEVVQPLFLRSEIQLHLQVLTFRQVNPVFQSSQGERINKNPQGLQKVGISGLGRHTNVLSETGGAVVRIEAQKPRE